MKGILTELLVGLLGIIFVFFMGRKNQEQRQKIDKLKDKADTLERINNVEVSTNRDDSLGRLRKAGRVRD